MEEYTKFARKLALRAGDIMRQNFKIGMKKEWKDDNTPLTKTDLAINELVISGVKKNFPDHGIIAEEGSNFHNEEYVWVCDPVDGTIPFSHGYPTFTFSLALVKNGSPVLGILYDPILERFIMAESGKGTYLNGRQVKVSDSSSLAKSIIGFEVLDSNYDGARKKLIQSGAFLISFACISYSSLLVAVGESKAAIWYGTSPWDGAAVQIIIEEAGGVCTDIYGNKQRYNQEIKGIVASNKHVHPVLINMIKESLS